MRFLFILLVVLLVSCGEKEYVNEPPVEKELGASAVPSKKSFSVDFESCDPAKEARNWETFPDEAVLVEDLVRSGNCALELTGKLTHNNKDPEGTNVYVAYSVFVPAAYDGGILGSWEPAPREAYVERGGETAPVITAVLAGERIQFLYMQQEIVSVPFAREEWHDLVFHIKWSSTPKGFVQVWVDGESVVQATGKNMYLFEGNAVLNEFSLHQGVVVDDIRMSGSYEEATLQTFAQR
ncbi:MAG: heparin lyase I family protein [Candidatus Woesearchaeota archaeon]|nr:heparin lyase I family protein [Candidatus Woesearchaeota archaeon]